MENIENVNQEEVEVMELEEGDVIQKEYQEGVLICEVVGEHQWDKMYEINVLFTSIGRNETIERDKSDKPLYAQFPEYKSQKLSDLRR